MPAENYGSEGSASDFGDPAGKSEADARGERLKDAVRAAGGPSTVIAKTGISESTLGNYQKGGEMKLSSAIALAQATGVRLVWLATGIGPRTDAGAEQAATPPAKPPAPSPLLSDRVDMEKLVPAYRAALQVEKEPEAVMRLTLRFHDVLAAQEETAARATTADNPQRPETVKTP
jgi:hypothetical protein